MSEWQDIKTAPKDGTAILAALIYRDGNHIDEPLTIRWHEPWGQWVMSGCLIGIQNNAKDDENADPTHWMPLPSLPVTDAATLLSSSLGTMPSIAERKKADASAGIYKHEGLHHEFVPDADGNLVGNMYRTYDGITEVVEPNVPSIDEIADGKIDALITKGRGLASLLPSQPEIADGIVDEYTVAADAAKAALVDYLANGGITLDELVAEIDGTGEGKTDE